MELRKPALVGREDELRRIEAATARALRGHGAVVVVTGEPGIGKTRLAEEACDGARRLGARVLRGQAYALEGSLAYGPLREALGSYLHGLERRRQLALTEGLAHLGRLVDGLGLPEPRTFGDPALEKARLFEAVARLIERLAAEAPVVLVLDDLQWADPASVELLHYVARGIARQRVLVLLTLTPGDGATGTELAAFVTSLERSIGVERVELARLAPPDVAALVADALGGEASERLVAQLRERTDGTPLFVQLLLGALADADRLEQVGGLWVARPGAAVSLPPAVRELIARRIERLDDDARRVLETMAMAGPVGLAVLRRAAGLGDAALMSALGRLRRAGLAAEERQGPEIVCRLAHPLIGEVVHDGLGEAGRQWVHASLARAIEGEGSESLEALARHYVGAGTLVEPGRAVDLAVAAGRRALELGAPETAAQQFGSALAIVREGHRIELLPSLLERLGEAWERLGEGGAALAVWEEARREHERAGSVGGVARVHRLSAMAEWDRGRFEVARRHLAEGLAVLAGSEPSDELADLHHTRIVLAARSGDLAEHAAATADLAAVAARLGSPRAAVEAALAAAVLDLQAAPYAEIWDRLTGVLAAAEAAGEPVLAQRAVSALALLANSVGDHREQRRQAETALEIARRLGAPTLELFPRANGVFSALRSGAWDDALAESAAALVLARRLGIPRQVAGALSIRAVVLARRGEVRAARACLDEAGSTYRGGEVADRNIFDVTGYAEVTLHLELGNAARAAELADGLARSPSLPLTALATQVLALLGEAQAGAGKAADALFTAARIADAARSDNPFAAALAHWVEGLARRALGDPQPAAASLASAIAGFEALEMPFEAARARLEWAAATTAMSQPEAARAAQDALHVFERLGARRHADRARALLRELGVRPAPPARRRGRAALSERELEIARLIADGLTNRQIAERLVISPRTVGTHLDRMYERLGLPSRAALARYVVESGAVADGAGGVPQAAR